MNRLFSVLFFLTLFLLPLKSVYPQTAVPYSPTTHSASYAYRSLSPYYVQQENESSCSLATITMIVNALLSQTATNFTPQTQKEVLERSHDRTWTKAVARGGPGITLNQCASILKKVLRAYGLHVPRVDVRHVSHPHPSKGLLHKALHLLASKKRLRCLLIANFDQSILIPIGTPVGHFSPLGDYNISSRHVLVMDVDREWTGPYWVKRSRLLRSLHTVDTDSRIYRGYLAIWIGKRELTKAEYTSPATPQCCGIYPQDPIPTSTVPSHRCAAKDIAFHS